MCYLKGKKKSSTLKDFEYVVTKKHRVGESGVPGF